MQCILIFDQLNDILYSKCNKKFLQHSLEVAREQGLVVDDEVDFNKINTNIIIQLFSPIITSQRFMTCQFGNSYTSIECEDGINLVFNEYMGYLFVQIGTSQVKKLSRNLGICISFVKHICGPNVPILKTNSRRSGLLSSLLDTWFYLQENNQAVLVEAIEQLLVNNCQNATTLKTLQESVDRLSQNSSYTKVHALMLVENKFISLYSSRNAEDLTPADIMFLGFLAESLNLKDEMSKNSEENYSLLNSNGETCNSGMDQCNPRINFEEVIEGLHSYVLLLTGNHSYAVYVGCLANDVQLFLLLECGNPLVSVGLNDAFLALNALQSMQLQKDVYGVRHAFEFLDSGMKKIFEGLKKSKSIKMIETCHKNLRVKWDALKKKYLEFIKSGDSECMTQIESNTSRFLDGLKIILEITCLDDSVLLGNRFIIGTTFTEIKNELREFSEFLQVKELRNFTLGSKGSLSINKYLGEFPGLVHFIYIDRYLHRLTAPGFEDSVLTKKQLWAMIDFSRSHLQEGHLSLMWKDNTFSYGYFMWFENPSGSPLKPKIYPSSVIKNFPPPGILIEDFYKRLIEACFPKMSPSKVRCYELFCIHLGLVTSSCVLEHSRRLAATISEVTGVPSNLSVFF